METERPLIVDIKRNSTKDGPGIRSVVFFKGCPMACIFCHNPECQSREKEIAFLERDCIHCGRCETSCPQKAVDLNDPKRVKRDLCSLCGKCAEKCPGKGLTVIGSYFSPGELADICLRDLPFYEHSGGGVTLSGGECTLYPDFLEALLVKLKSKKVHIILETCGYFNYEVFKEKMLPYTDLVYYDIKFADPVVHNKYTGKSNELILDNLYHILKEERIDVNPRIPLIPHITATKDNLTGIVKLLYGMGAKKVSLIPYNPMGSDMYRALGRPIPPISEHFMTYEEETEINNLFKLIIKSNI